MIRNTKSAIALLAIMLLSGCAQGDVFGPPFSEQEILARQLAEAKKNAPPPEPEPAWKHELPPCSPQLPGFWSGPEGNGASVPCKPYTRADRERDVRTISEINRRATPQQRLENLRALEEQDERNRIDRFNQATGTLRICSPDGCW